MLGGFAEFERAIVVERIHAGLARARAQGKRLSRPLTPEAAQERIRELRARGMSLRRIAEEVGISKSTVVNYDPKRAQGKLERSVASEQAGHEPTIRHDANLISRD